MTILIREVRPVDADGFGFGAPDATVDVVVEAGRIARIEASGTTSTAGAGGVDTVIDGAGRLLMPGFVDAHAHADGLLFDADVQLSLAEREPASSPQGEKKWLLDLTQVQQLAIERARRRLTAPRRCDLDVMEARDSCHRVSRPSYSGFDLAPQAMNVIPSGPAPAWRLASAPTRR